MAKSARGLSAKDYKSVGTTFDGVRILAPKLKATSFTTAEIRQAIASVLDERDSSATEAAGHHPARRRAKPKAKSVSSK